MNAVSCSHVGPWTGRPCLRPAGHSGLHRTWPGAPVVAIEAPAVRRTVLPDYPVRCYRSVNARLAACPSDAEVVYIEPGNRAGRYLCARHYIADVLEGGAP